MGEAMHGIGEALQGHSQASEPCPLCGTTSTTFFDELSDRLFGVSGRFQLDRCPSCSLVWLHAMPPEEQVGQFYAEYYTHNDERPAEAKQKSGVQGLFNRVWPIGSQRRKRRELAEFFLPDSGGTVMEIGCGGGRNLAQLRSRGWRVVGQEIDPIAAEAARDRFHVNVEAVPVSQLSQPDDSLQAILLNHVVEHLREPIRDLGKCHDILDVGGRLVIITPNVDSLGRRLFGRRWRGLEPPRHLFLYNVRTMRTLLERAGFTEMEVFTRGARTEMITFDTIQSLVQHRSGTFRYALSKSGGMLAQLLADVSRVDGRDRGDELVAIATKS
jgi:SAM-dependent methyltransferase